MDPHLLLLVATLAFVGTHFVPSTPLRAALARALGERGYLALYSLVALATLWWMIHAYLRAPVEPLWSGLRFVPALVMPFAFMFLVGGLMQRNPTAVAQGRFLVAEDPARGILRVTRHPVMWAILLWAGAHALARGNLKSLIFFGGFLLLAALGTRFIDARKARTHGADWKRFVALTSNVPFAAIAQRRNRLRLGEIGLVKAVFGLILYGGMMQVHAWLFGVPPW
jgi:uncharacterized membrane protein